jgi:hypothetical protein
MSETTTLDYRIQLDVLSKGYDRKFCWVSPAIGTIPGTPPVVVVLMQKLLLSRDDVFYCDNEMRTSDMGKSWIGPVPHEATLGRRLEKENVEVICSGMKPHWHRKSQKLLAIGHTCKYSNNKNGIDTIILDPACRVETCYSVYNNENHTWSCWDILQIPDQDKFYNHAAGATQRYEMPNGDILLPIYFKSAKSMNYKATIARCKFDGSKLHYLEHGNELFLSDDRGLVEHSITRFQDRYYLTIRNDITGYVSTSTDGMHFDAPIPWRFDDGQNLGSYNTQQRWITHCDGLFLVYTRRGANNDHIFRHRAPLFIAQVDPERQCVIRKTERILVPERGARLCNFQADDVTRDETWVTVAEWMQTIGPNPYDCTICEKYGSDNSVFVARIIWNKPNVLAI